MRRTLLYGLIFLAAILFPYPSDAATYNVAKTCGGQACVNTVSCNQAQNVATAKLTIAAGLACLGAGDTLVIGAGTYAESIMAPSLPPSGISDAQRTTVRAATGASVIITGDASGNNGMSLLDRRYITFDGLTFSGRRVIIGCSQGGTCSSFITIQNGIIRDTISANYGNASQSCLTQQGNGGANTNLVFRNLEIYNCGPTTGHGIYMTAANTIAENNHIHDTASHGLQLYQANGFTGQNNIVRNNRIHDMQIGIGLYTDTHNIYNNIIYNTQFAGIKVSGTASTVDNNTIYNGTRSFDEQGSGNTIRNNLIFNNPSGITGAGANTHANNVTADPHFVDAASGDFRLQASSTAAINQGVTIGTITTDFAGTSRPQGAAYDVGAYEFVGTDTTPPTITGRTPADTATNIAVNTTVTATFSEAMNASTITGSSFTLKIGATPVSASVSYNSGTNTATLTPSANLVEGTTYTATIVGGGSGAKDSAGNALAANSTWTFTTSVSPLTITGRTPTAGDTSVTPTAPVTATFNRAMNAATLTTSTILLKNAANVAVTGTVAYNSGTNTVTFTPASALTENVTYTATVVCGPSGVMDSLGNQLATEEVWSFTVVSTPPTVTGQTPTSGATGIAKNTTVTATFNEAMDAATLTTNTVILKNPRNQIIAGTVSYNAGTKTVTLTPTNPLAENILYTATAIGGPGGVKDASGEAMAADSTWTFTTVNEIPSQPVQMQGNMTFEGEVTIK